MTKLLLKQNGDHAVGELKSNRHWFQFFAESEGSKQNAFQLFVATADGVNPGFRTLVWNADLPGDQPLLTFANDYFRVAYQDDFSVFDQAQLDRLEFVVSLLGNEQETPRFNTYDSGDRIGTAMSLQNCRLDAVKFARFDFKSDKGLLGLSYRDLPEKGLCELTLLLESSICFRREFLARILDCHALSDLRENPQQVDLSELIAFINERWDVE
jgi:hypothetical protein